MPSGDVFPRRNLPPEAEQWGREVEKRVSGAEQALEISGQALSGINRNIASSISLLADQQRVLSEQQQVLGEQQIRLAEVISSMAIARSGAVTNTAFGMGPGWNNVATVSLTAPAGKSIVSVVAVASGQITAVLNGNLATLEQRMVINGTATPAMQIMYKQGENVLYNPVVASGGGTFSGNVTVSLQILPGSTGAFPPRSDSSVSLAVIGVYN